VTEEKFYNCMYDRAFKEVMLNEKNKKILKCVLETALKVKINDITIINQELNNNNIHIKRKYVDAYLKTEEGIIEIEINAYPENYVHPRNMAYISNIYASNILKGEAYTEVSKIVQINFTYNLKNNEKTFRIYKVQDDEGNTFVNNLVIYEFNMDAYLKLWYNNNKKGIEDNKYIIMMGLNHEELKRLSSKDEIVGEYMEELEKVNKNPEFIEFMSFEEDQRKIRNSQMNEATSKGLAQGLEEGLKQGIEQGTILGKKEAQKQMALKMLNRGLSIDEIIDFTELTKEEIDSLN